MTGSGNEKQQENLYQIVSYKLSIMIEEGIFSKAIKILL